MTSTIFQAPVCSLNSFNNLFIELTAKNCNQRCSHCYIDFPLTKNVKDFISTDIIKKAISDTKNEDIQCIYLCGAEPMTHPDFNTILRMCLKRSNVCIFTNGTFINEKKARFLKKVQDEGQNEIIFKLSIDHYDEMKNDEVRSRGSYRITLNAVKFLIKYGFNPILCITNYYNEPKQKLIDEFTKICTNIGFETKNNNFIINRYYDSSENFEDLPSRLGEIDCKYGRILTAKGVYSCPFLANDHRGRCGSSFEDFSSHISLETPFCNNCMKNQRQMFGINFELFEN